MTCEHCFRRFCNYECPTDSDVAECAECGRLIGEDETICYCFDADDPLTHKLDTEKFNIKFVGRVEGYSRGSTLCAECAEKIRNEPVYTGEAVEDVRELIRPLVEVWEELKPHLAYFIQTYISNLRTSLRFILFDQMGCIKPRVRHLLLNSKSARVRKKNLKRAIAMMKEEGLQFNESEVNSK